VGFTSLISVTNVGSYFFRICLYFRYDYALSLSWVPIGTVIGILILLYLIKPEVREYFAASS